MWIRVDIFSLGFSLFTRAALARALGGHGRIGDAPLPRSLSRALPATFVATLGAHIARERVERGAAAAP